MSDDSTNEYCILPEFTVNTQFMWTLVVVCNPALASTPLAPTDQDMLIANLWFAVWPDDGHIIMDDKLETAT
jgi:hypothetical protein